MHRIIYHREEIQIVFKSDQGLKEQALEKARLEGITLKAMLTMAMRAYVNDEFEIMFGRKPENRELSPPKFAASPIKRRSRKIKMERG